ncbi:MULTISPECIES: MarR family winged helix-turn-helix transcriptional regulator [unclassified Pseudomonas]|uniref:MarR family winged helix-turn-helix transcriptional regulator n=1 Tax=unclassified Pseudomonas TaxID=196821 RepID=UPI000BD468D0|nr:MULTISPECIES: MarR family transcriptional regulator [unclassified Pseudomonas]PVZ23938.1 DNA-binding MarR family transcriptional regulator [Pseudomonas sp. URIL14HWK12:I10]PVZ33423.1 DNA-binding MarR family transcriptional regulator [Pseudomonas sp. URIL14HWK12:I11]SNZ11506.1 transcriptional regulator, MarR family [Pseudomonas sp. URIL14HWK12:I9]
MLHFTPATFGDCQLPMLIGRTAILKDRTLDRHLEPYEITSAQFKVLIIVARGYVDTPAELCRYLALDSGSMTRMLDRLEQKQLIERTRSAADRRQVHLALTAAGQALADRLPEIGAAALNELVSMLEPAEFNELQRILRKILIHAGDSVACSFPGNERP